MNYVKPKSKELKITKNSSIRTVFLDCKGFLLLRTFNLKTCNWTMFKMNYPLPHLPSSVSKSDSFHLVPRPLHQPSNLVSMPSVWPPQCHDTCPSEWVWHIPAWNLHHNLWVKSNFLSVCYQNPHDPTSTPFLFSAYTFPLTHPCFSIVTWYYLCPLSPSQIFQEPTCMAFPLWSLYWLPQAKLATLELSWLFLLYFHSTWYTFC